MSVSASVVASLATVSTQSTPPEIYSPKFTTTLTAAILTGLRPTVISVAATNTIYSQGTYSIAIYDAGTDASPVNFEALEVIGGGGGLTWTVVTESGWNSIAHANGSTVVATVFTSRSVQQPLVNHITPTSTPDPHPLYVKKASYGAKGNVLVGTANGAYTNLPVGADGTSPVADSTQTSGIRWAGLSIASVLKHMGDMIVGGVLGATTQLGIGAVGQILTTIAGPDAIPDPVSAPSLSAGAGTGLLTNGLSYDFAYAWQNGVNPDGGTTIASPLATAAATSSGIIAVQCPASPLAGATLLIYGAVHNGTLNLQGALTLASTSGTNTVNVSNIGVGDLPASLNTTGGITAAWDVLNAPTTAQQVRLSASTGIKTVTVPSTFGASGPPHGPGDVPDPGSSTGSTRYLREDATWQVPPGTGVSSPIIQSQLIGAQAGLKANAIQQQFQPSGTGHAQGVVPDPGASAGATRYLREDATWDVPPGAITTVTIPDLTIGAQSGLKALALEQVFGPSGVLHAIGNVPDPGQTASAARYLREDASWQIPPGSGASGLVLAGLIPIQTVTPSGVGTATIAVPHGYRNLRLTVVGQGTASAASVNVNLQFNGDTTSGDYANVVDFGGSAGTSSATSGVGTGAYIGDLPAATNTSGAPGSLQALIPIYSATTFTKNVIAFGGYAGSTLSAENTSATWNSTAAITSIAVVLGSGNFAAGSLITLWAESDTLPSINAMGSSVPVQTQTPSSVSSVTFTVPAGFKNLYVTGDVASSTSATQTQLQLQFNGDSGSNYDGLVNQSNTTFANLTESFAGSSMPIGDVPAATAPSGTSGTFRADIEDYAGTTFHKSVRLAGVVKLANTTTNLQVIDGIGYWRNTAAITSITLSLAAGNFVTGSTLTLWAASDKAVGGVGGSGVPVIDVLGTDVSLSSTNTYFDGPSVSVGPGTWLLTGNATVQNTSSGANFTGQLWDGTTPAASEEVTTGATNASAGLDFASVVSPVVTTTYKISVACDASGGVIKATAPTNGAGVTATSLVASPIFGYAESTSAAVITNGNTITTSGVTAARVAPAGTVTGIILQPGTYGGQVLAVVNESSNTVTFDVSGTSNVASGTSTTVSALTQSLFTWDAATSLWYEQAGGTGGVVSQNTVVQGLTLRATAGMVAIPVLQVFGPSGTTHAVGLVVDPGASSGSTRFLREDGSWAVPAGTGGGGSGATIITGTGGLVPILTQQPVGSSSLTFTVPTGYRNLRFTGIARSDNASNYVDLRLQLNGDSGSNYNYERLQNVATTPQSAEAYGQTSFQATVLVVGSNGTSGRFGGFEGRIENHSDSVSQKTIYVNSTASATDSTTNDQTCIEGGIWRSTAAVTSITFFLSAGNFVAGSTVTLWGESDVPTTTLSATASLIAIPLPQVFGPSGAGHAIGGAPDPGSTPGQLRFLREDATWQTPSGSSTGGTGGSIVPIQTQTLSAAAASVTFSVPAGFKNLYVTLDARGDTSATSVHVGVQLNGDTGSNYDWMLNSIAAGTVGGTQGQASTEADVLFISAATAPSNVSGSGVISLRDYAGTTFNKTIEGRGGYKIGTSSGQQLNADGAGFWRSTAAITSIALVPSAGNFITGSTFTLWGESDTAPVLLTSNSNLIQETSLLVDTASIAIPTIPQGYKDIRISYAQGRSSVATVDELIELQINGDTGAHYNYNAQYLRATGVISADTGLGATFATFAVFPGTTAVASSSVSGEIIIKDYANPAGTFWHSIMAQSVLQDAANVANIYENFSSIHWQSTAPITSLLLFPATGLFKAGMVVRVYGEPASAAGPSVGTGTRARSTTSQYIPVGIPTDIQWTINDQDSNNQHLLNPAPGSLTGTIAKTAGSQTLTGTGTSFTTQLAVGQVIRVPGGAVVSTASLSAHAGMNQQNNQMPASTSEADVSIGSTAGMDAQSTSMPFVVIAIASNTSLTTSRPAIVTASGGCGLLLNSAITFPQAGMYDYTFGAYLAALSSGSVTLQVLLNGTTVIAQSDASALSYAAGYVLTDMRPFQQWDFIEAYITQTDVNPSFILPDERSHFSILGRPTVTVAVPYINIQDVKAAPSDGGTFTSGSWQQRTLNTIVNDSAGISSLSSNQITLPPGTYRCEIVAPAAQCGTHALRLRNVTDSATIIRGTTQWTQAAAAGDNGVAYVRGRFTLTSAKVLQIEHYCSNTRTTYGFGVGSASGGTLDGSNDVYTIAEFFKEG